MRISGKLDKGDMYLSNVIKFKGEMKLIGWTDVEI